jgi:hypoxanthine phosphoribosyltransferase
MTKRQSAIDPMQAVLDQSELLFDSDTIERAIDRLAIRITVDLAGRNPIAICILTGGLIFSGSLLQRLRFPLEIDYLHATRYQSRTEGSVLEWRALPTLPVQGRALLVIDDILDHGHTLAAVVAALRERGAADVRSAVLVDKDIGRQKPIAADYVALNCPDRYLFGRGMDYKGYWRNLPEIYAIPDNLLKG